MPVLPEDQPAGSGPIHSGHRWPFLAVLTGGMAVIRAVTVASQLYRRGGIDGVEFGPIVDAAFGGALCGSAIGIALWYGVIRSKRSDGP